jgi:soluble lytic murein transglycosylase-like protein
MTWNPNDAKQVPGRGVPQGVPPPTAQDLEPQEALPSQQWFDMIMDDDEDDDPSVGPVAEKYYAEQGWYTTRALHEIRKVMTRGIPEIEG